jgi:hypothetical protein
MSYFPPEWVPTMEGAAFLVIVGYALLFYTIIAERRRAKKSGSSKPVA